jgi:hypothetical protein
MVPGAQRVPFGVLGLDSDNGSEFINHELLAYCRWYGITFTRSRLYQKNGQVVRRLVGHDWYNSRKALEALKRLYTVVRHFSNFFQPVMQLQQKTRDGANVRKVYDAAATPYRRLLASPHPTGRRRAYLPPNGRYAGLMGAGLAITASSLLLPAPPGGRRGHR